MIVSRSRSFIKSITWRLIGLIVTFMSAYIVTGEKETATRVTIITNTIMFILYYAHERWWNHIQWGRK